MAMEITSNYGAQSMMESSVTEGTKRKETESRQKSRAEYARELAKLVPSAEFKIGNGFSPGKSSKTLTVNPQLLEKMQNDPETEKEMKELIKGAELAVKRLDSVMHAMGWSVVFKHDYIDENGKYQQICLVRNDFMLNMSDKLREERRKNSEELIEKTKEKAEKAKQLLEDKIAASKDGKVYLDDTDILTIMEAAREDCAAGDNAVKVSISREGMEKYLEQIREKNAEGKVIQKGGNKESIVRQANQMANALSANSYARELAEEMKKAKDLNRAYGNLYDRIVQGYENGTRERYTEDKNSETGYRKMTKEEELKGLSLAFQKKAHEEDVKKMISEEFKRLKEG